MGRTAGLRVGVSGAFAGRPYPIGRRGLNRVFLGLGRAFVGKLR